MFTLPTDIKFKFFHTLLMLYINYCVELWLQDVLYKGCPQIYASFEFAAIRAVVCWQIKKKKKLVWLLTV